MSTFILVEHNQQEMHPGTRHVVSAAKHFDENLVLLVVGYQCESVAIEVATIEGVAAVWLVDDLCYAHPLAENISQLVVSFAPSFSTILAASSTFGKDVLPRVAALLNVTQVSDVVEVIDQKTFVHPIYAGNALETVRILDDQNILSIRTTAFDAVLGSQPACGIERLNAVFKSKGTEFISHELSGSLRPSLSDARVVVSGGRGMQSAEQFKLVLDLADVLGAGVGASRAAVDAGFVSNDHQVGQTGQVVAPDLYIALGISGAVQHMAGMKDSKVIVAINKDEDAPIFQIADYGLVGDVFELVPQWIQLMKQ
ncbi:MAG: FAD-binding protein [Legionellales bacterium]|nr:FAD-binding protein [Legionellales bacterium]